MIGLIVGAACLVVMLAVPYVLWATRSRPRERTPWTPDEYHRGVMRREAEVVLRCTYDNGRKLTRAEALAWYRKHNPSMVEYIDDEVTDGAE